MPNFNFSDIPGQLMIRGYRPNRSPEKKVLKEDLDAVLKALDIKKLNPLQEKALYGVKSNLDLFLVGPEGIGKTTAYLILILIELFEEIKSNIESPVAVINCGSTERGLHLEALFKNVEFLQSIGGKAKVVLLDSVNSLEDLSSDFHILIVTGSFLQCAFSSSSQPHQKIPNLNINFEGMKFVVFDELAMQQHIYSAEVHRFLEFFMKRKCNLTNFQIIFSGTEWNFDTDELFDQFFDCSKESSRKAALIFGSAFQAIQYSNSNLKWNVRHCHPRFNTKLNKLAEICQSLQMQIADAPNIMIACGSNDTAECVSNFLSRNAKINNTLVACGQNGVYRGLFRENTEWMGKIYVVSDEALDLLHVEDITCLINYDIDSDGTDRKEGEPFSSKRFACIWNKIGNTDGQNDEMRLYLYALMTGEERNFLTLYNFLQDINVQMPSSLKQIAERKAKVFVECQPLCQILKCFGFCTKLGCTQRHSIIQDDIKLQADGPLNGEIEFKVIRCESPSLYHVKLLRHFIVDENGERKCVKVYRDELLERIDELREYYKNLKNRTHPLTISRGQQFCVQYSSASSGQELFFRVEIMNLPKEEGVQSHPRLAEVVCLDTGTITRVQIDKLLVLPKNFQSWSNHYVQLVLTNIIAPVDANNEYFAKGLGFARAISEDKIFQGKVLLSLRDTVWVNPMIQYVENPITGLMETGLNMKTELVHAGHALFMNHHTHVKIMQDHIRKVDPNFPEIEHELNSGSFESCMKFHERGDPVKWMSIEMSKVEDESVALNLVIFKVHAWIDPWEIYGVVVDSRDKDLETPVMQLERNLTEEIENTLLPRFKSDASVLMAIAQTLKKGMVIAVKGDEDVQKRWQRGIILEMVEEEDVCQKLNIFLVDYGITKLGGADADQVLPLPRDFADALPFQTVCLKLAHVQPLSQRQEWMEEDVKKFSEILSADTYLDVVVYGNVKGTGHPCNFYQAFTMQRKTRSTSSIGECVGMQLVRRENAGVTLSHRNIISKLEETLLPKKFLKLNMNSFKESKDCVGLRSIRELEDEGELKGPGPLSKGEKVNQNLSHVSANDNDDRDYPSMHSVHDEGEQDDVEDEFVDAESNLGSDDDDEDDDDSKFTQSEPEKLPCNIV